MLLLIKRASICNLGSQYNDSDLGRSTLGRCFLYINTHMLLLIKRASICNLGSQYNDCDLGRSTLGRCFFYIDTHSDQGRSVVVD